MPEPSHADGPPAEAIKPRLRGWLHAGMTPVVLAAGIVLISLAPAGAARICAAVYTGCGLVLFATSGAYHRGRWSPTVHRWFKRADHGNVYLLIAGTYTPIVTLGLAGRTRTVLLAIVWAGAAVGIGFRWLYPDAPRAFYTALSVVLGWSVAPAFGQLLVHAGTAVAVLALVGGILYTAGAVTYATRRPDPSPAWFGFHEIFHALTVAAWTCQYVAVSVLSYRGAAA